MHDQQSEVRARQGTVLFLVVLCTATIVAAVYLWKSSEVRDIQRDTRLIERRLNDLERENATLMIQLAKSVFVKDVMYFDLWGK